MNKGLVHVYTGDGKGKTTAAVGLAVRAAGAGKRVLFSQFLKGQPTAELEPISRLGITVLRSDEVTKFIPYMNAQELKDCRQEQQQVFDTIRSDVQNYDMVILDEIFGAISTGMIETQKVIELIKEKPDRLELVFTGRGAPEQIVELADYVSDIHAVKHPYDKGIPARKGIEF